MVSLDGNLVPRGAVTRRWPSCASSAGRGVPASFNRLMDVGCGQGLAFPLLRQHFAPREIVGGGHRSAHARRRRAPPRGALRRAGHREGVLGDAARSAGWLGGRRAVPPAHPPRGESAGRAARAASRARARRLPVPVRILRAVHQHVDGALVLPPSRGRAAAGRGLPEARARGRLRVRRGARRAHLDAVVVAVGFRVHAQDRPGALAAGGHRLLLVARSKKRAGGKWCGRVRSNCSRTSWRALLASQNPLPGTTFSRHHCPRRLVSLLARRSRCGGHHVRPHRQPVQRVPVAVRFRRRTPQSRSAARAGAGKPAQADRQLQPGPRLARRPRRAPHEPGAQARSRAERPARQDHRARARRQQRRRRPVRAAPADASKRSSPKTARSSSRPRPPTRTW